MKREEKMLFIFSLLIALITFQYINAGELVNYKYLNKPIPNIKERDVDDVIVDLLNPVDLLPPKYQEIYKNAPPNEREKILQRFVFVLIFFDVDKNKRVLDYVRRYEKDFMTDKHDRVIILMIETSGRYSTAELREKVIDVENTKKGIYVVNGGKIYRYMFQSNKYYPLLLIVKYNPKVKSLAEKPLSKFVVQKALAEDFTFDDMIAAINEFLK